jgi:small-conductance mechanosensitive channel
MTDNWKSMVERFHALDIHLFRLGTTSISLFDVVQVLVLIALLLRLTRWVAGLTAERLLGRTHLDMGTRQAIAAIVRYSLLIIGTLAILQNYGIQLTAFTVLAGAVGVGVGFGLQQIITNFIAGLILMFERPIKVGDRIELGTLEGDVTDIGPRRTTVVTNDHVAIIVPNSKFITDNVVNLRYHNAPIRVRVPMVVAPGSDPRAVERLVCEVARAHNDVLENPPPAARLTGLLGAGALGFELQVWNSSRIHDRTALISELYFAILDRLDAQGIKLA